MIQWFWSVEGTSQIKQYQRRIKDAKRYCFIKKAQDPHATHLVFILLFLLQIQRFINRYAFIYLDYMNYLLDQELAGCSDESLFIGDIIGFSISNYQCQLQIAVKMQEKQYKLIKQIGKGSFGTVELVKSISNGNKYVIKKLELTNTNKQCIAKQVKIMKDLKHQFITKYYDSFINSDNQMCIVMEYAENGELQQYLNRRKTLKQPLEEEQILDWFIQLCLGLKYIHDHRVLHRDLKCENIFISSQNQLKIGDFGISKLMHETFDMAKTKIGTPYVMAPEIWENKMYNQKSDLWSLGCILYKMMTLSHAFEAQNAGAYIIKITSGTYNPIYGNFSKQLKQLVTEMLSLQPQNRPSVHSILERSFIKQRVQGVLSKSITNYYESLALQRRNPNREERKRSNEILSKRKSSTSLSHSSSLLTPKNTSTTNESNKIVEMKQSYPLLVEESKQLKVSLSKNQKQKEQFIEGCQQILNNLRQQCGKGKNENLREHINKLEYEFTSYLYP